MGNVRMEARQINYRGGESITNVEEAIKNAGSTYELPIAGEDTLGGVKVGTGLSIDSETGVLSISSGVVVGIDTPSYSDLPTATKNNGSLYIVNTDKKVPTHAIDMTNITKFEEGSTTITATSATKTTITTDGQSIGATYYYTTPIDVTNIDSIQATIKAIAQYTPFADRLSLTIGLCSTAPAAIASNYTDLNYAVYDKITTTGDKTATLDTSSLSGNYYIVVNCPGWSATIENIKDDSTYDTEIEKYDMFFKSTKLLTKTL